MVNSANYRVVITDVPVLVLNRSDLPAQSHGIPRADVNVLKCHCTHCYVRYISYNL